MVSETEVYLGDAVHASFDGFQIELRTRDGNNQVIYLEPNVLHALFRYASRVMPNVIWEATTHEF